MLEELAHVHDEIADDRKPGQGAQLDRLLERLQIGDAGKPVPAVDIHRVGSAHAFATGPAKRERVVLRLEPDDRVEQHAVVRIERDVVILHPRRSVFVRVVAINGEFHQ